MKKVLLLFSIMFLGLSANAVENVLQTIQIEPVKDTYNIVLTADNSVDVRKNVEASNKISLTLKDIRASKTLNTIYDNVPDVDSVIVEPKGEDGLTIFIQAENAEKATITFDKVTAPINSALASKRPNPAKEILINKPIKSYSPVYDDDDFLDEGFSGGNFLATVLNKVKNIQVNDKINQIIMFGLAGIMFLFGVKLFRRKDNEMAVGLAQSLKDREVNIYKNMRGTMPSISVPLEKPYSSAYGMKAYQNMPKNPYDTEIKRNYTTSTAKQNFSNPIRKQTVSLAEKTQSNLKQKVAVKSSVTTQPRPENLKFLETMSAIYEKSGRHDLAQGIKTSMQKATTKS